MKRLLTCLLLSTVLFSCKKDDDAGGGANTGDGYKGYLYTSTNSTAGNGIIAMGRKEDGSLTELPNSPYMTGSAGDAAEGDFDSQWGLRMVGDYLLAVNAGNNPVNSTVSVFKINRTNGSLTQVDQNPSTSGMDNMDSRGLRATSIAAKAVGGSTWIVVGNQFANPHYETPAKTPVGTVMSTPLRNLAVFTFNESNGLLEYKSIGATFSDGTYGGPTTVEFNSDGSKVAVSTWGVTHIMAPDADTMLQKPSRLYIYDFNGGNLSQTGVYEEKGVSGSIGFSWSPNGQYIYLSNFNLHSSKEDHSVTVHNSTTGAKIQNFTTADRNDEACWTWVSLDRTKLFTASFGTNFISVFDIGGDGRLGVSLNPNFFARGGAIPMADTKDMHQSPDNYLYVAGAFMTHSVSVFKIGGNGALTEMSGSPYRIPSSAGKTPMEHAFIGLTGFEK